MFDRGISIAGWTPTRIDSVVSSSRIGRSWIARAKPTTQTALKAPRATTGWRRHGDVVERRDRRRRSRSSTPRRLYKVCRCGRSSGGHCTPLYREAHALTGPTTRKRNRESRDPVHKPTGRHAHKHRTTALRHVALDAGRTTKRIHRILYRMRTPAFAVYGSLNADPRAVCRDDPLFPRQS